LAIEINILFMEDFMQKVSLTDMPKQEAQPGDNAYVVPVETVPLPSGGKVYPETHAFYNTDRIEIRAMTAKEEDILTSSALLRAGKAVTALVKSCLINKSVDPDALLVGDRSAIMVAIRILGYGAEYKIEVECPDCGEKCKHQFDLSKLPIKELSAEPVNNGTNLFSFVLPMLKKEVLFRLPTGNDEREMNTIIERTKKATNAETNVTTKLSFLVSSFGGETDGAKIANLVRNMPARDSRALNKYIGKIAPTIDMTQEFTCPACTKSSEVEVPLGTEFFWPREE
jgi:hypothetical protein